VPLDLAHPVTGGCIDIDCDVRRLIRAQSSTSRMGIEVCELYWTTVHANIASAIEQLRR